METRKGKMVVNISGSGSSTFRATLPANWIRKLGLNEDIRNLILEFDGEEIIIKNDEEMNEMEITKMEMKYMKTLEILEELGKIDIDNIEDLNTTFRELTILGHEVYIEEGYLKLDTGNIDHTIEQTMNQINEIIADKDIITIEQLDEIELIANVYVESAGRSGTGKGSLYVAYLNDEDGNKTDIELAELVVGI